LSEEATSPVFSCPAGPLAGHGGPGSVPHCPLLHTHAPPIAARALDEIRETLREIGIELTPGPLPCLPHRHARSDVRRGEQRHLHRRDCTKHKGLRPERFDPTSGSNKKRNQKLTFYEVGARRGRSNLLPNRRRQGEFIGASFSVGATSTFLIVTRPQLPARLLPARSCWPCASRTSAHASTIRSLIWTSCPRIAVFAWITRSMQNRNPAGGAGACGLLHEAGVALETLHTFLKISDTNPANFVQD